MANFTEEQVLAIETPGRVIVSASAGSGKTTVMIEKIIRLIKSGARVDELLAVTFTKKAAAQMKEKLSKALIEAINAPETTDEKRQELKEKLAEVPGADVSTIHSFCARLLRTHFFAADVDNAFRVIDGSDAEGTALKNAALDELFEEGYANKDDAEFAHLLSTYWRKKNDNALRRIFKDTYESLRARADYEDYLKASCAYSKETFEKIAEELRVRFQDKCRYYQEFILEEKYYFESKLETEQTQTQVTIATQIAEWLQFFIDAPDYFACAKAPALSVPTNSSRKTHSDETALHRKRLGAIKDRIKDEVKKEFSKLEEKATELEKFLRSGEAARALAICLLRFDEKYSALKKERGVLDYNDLEHKTLKLLEDEALVQSLKEKYKYVFVDEYQDVNPVQEALVSKISGDNLFLVGDVKQSIYGFRGSKSRFFVEKQNAFKGGEGESLKLTRNFRSADAVLDAVNTQFSLAMTPSTSAVDYKHDSYMERGGVYALNSGRVQLHFFGEGKKEKKEDMRGVYSVEAHADGTETEASRLAKYIYTIIEEECKKTYYNAEEKDDVPVTYGDIAVLSRKKKGEIAKTIASLSAMGLPVTSSSAINVCDYAEVKTLMDILSLLDNAEQDIPLCSALLSPMGDLTADELTSIRLCYGKGYTFRAACKAYAEEQGDLVARKLRSFYEYYEKTRIRASVLDAAELLTLLLSETRMEAALLKQKNGAACLRRIQRFIEEASSPEPMCLRAFLEKLRDMDNKIEYAESGGENSVKVLTMHSSKGLEYPVVILDNLSAPFRAADHDEVFVEEKYGLAPRAFDGKRMTKASTLLRRLYGWEEQESSLADELNLYYVALTRAQYALHLIFEERSVFSDVLYAKSFAELTDFSVWEKYAVTDELGNDFGGKGSDDLKIVADDGLQEAIAREYQREYPYQAYANLPVKSSATQLLAAVEKPAEEPLIAFGKVEKQEEDEGDRVVDDGGKTDTDTGLAYHAFLENFDFSLLFTKDGTRKTDEEIAAETKSAYARFAVEFVKEAALVTQEKATEILCNPVFAELYGMRLYKEQQFLVSLPVKDTYAKKEGVSTALLADNGEEMIFQGAIDLLAIGDKEIRIIDYKYSKRYAKALREHYKPQLDLYKRAVAKILKTDEKNIRCTIVNVYRGFQVDVD